MSKYWYVMSTHVNISKSTASPCLVCSASSTESHVEVSDAEPHSSK